MDQHTIELAGTLFAALITAMIGPSVVEYVKAKVDKSKEVIDPVKQELKQSCVINEELEEIRETLKADRVWITVIHNGGNFLHSKRSMQKFSVLYEVEKAGVSGIGMIFNNIPVSLFTRSIQHISSGEVILIENVDDFKKPTYGLKSAFESVGTKSAMSKGLFDIETDALIGTIGVDYLAPKKLKESDIKYFTTKSERLSGYISNFIKKI
jgi:hypothetical protein